MTKNPSKKAIMDSVLENTIKDLESKTYRPRKSANIHTLECEEINDVQEMTDLADALIAAGESHSDVEEASENKIINREQRRKDKAKAMRVHKKNLKLVKIAEAEAKNAYETLPFKASVDLTKFLPSEVQVFLDEVKGLIMIGLEGTTAHIKFNNPDDVRAFEKAFPNGRANG